MYGNFDFYYETSSATDLFFTTRRKSAEKYGNNDQWFCKNDFKIVCFADMKTCFHVKNVYPEGTHTTKAKVVI